MSPETAMKACVAFEVFNNDPYLWSDNKREKISQLLENLLASNNLVLVDLNDIQSLIDNEQVGIVLAREGYTFYQP